MAADYVAAIRGVQPQGPYFLGGWSMGGVVLTPTSFYSTYTPTVLNYAASHGGMLTQVVGNPFDVPKAELESSITALAAGYATITPLDGSWS